MTRAPGGLVLAGEKAICLSHPFRPTEPCSVGARALAAGKETVAIDILLVLRALPIATNLALSAPNVDPDAGLASDPEGVPELTPTTLVAAGLEPTGDEARFKVAGAEPGSVLFRITGNMLDGKEGDRVPKGAMCLFRPFSGEPDKRGIYLVRRTDGQAFGATGAEWTVGLMQVSPSGGMRIRYPGAVRHTDCATELVRPASTVELLALFVKPVA